MAPAPIERFPSQSQIGVVMVPLPAQGHLNQLLHLSLRLSTAGLPVHYVGSATHVRQARSRLHGWDLSSQTANINFHEFPTGPFESPAPDPNSLNKFPLHLMPAMSSSLDLRGPFITLVRDLANNFRRVVVIFDSLMSYVVQDLHSVMNAEAYCFKSISAFSVYSFNWDFRGRPDDVVPAGAEVLREAPGLEGCFSQGFLDFGALQDDATQVSCGQIYNSSRTIEGFYLDLLQKEMTSGGADRVWAIGPFNPVGLVRITTRHECLEWLDRQGPDSVIFVSFGTTSSLSSEQVRELAIGLERSGHKFIWVVRDADRVNIFARGSRRIELPEGYEERLKERAMIVRDWAPQLEILAHPSIGEFMTHCGWNSCMESISMGVPMVIWPMHSDQPKNATLVTKVLRVGVEVKDWKHWDQVVGSSMVEDSVRKLMGSTEGNELRKRARALGVATRDATMEGGITCNELDSFISHITR